MPRRRPSITRRTRISKVKKSRIRIPQPPDRPLQLRQRDLRKQEEIREDPWWFTLHKRGIRRARVGEDPLEARAVKKSTIRGTLPERIEYKYLTSKLRLSPSQDFNFQSSLDGGRLELGGIVADFLFQFRKLVIRVQGPTHDKYLRSQKDEEQRLALEGMGYRVLDLGLDEIYNEYRMDEWHRRNFTYTTTVGFLEDVWDDSNPSVLLYEMTPQILSISRKLSLLA